MNRFDMGLWTMITGVILGVITIIVILADDLAMVLEPHGLNVASVLTIVGTIIMFSWVREQSELTNNDTRVTRSK